MISFSVNSKPASFKGDDDTPLLWVLRDHLQLTGTKFGCGIGQCGACTVHLNGHAVRSCKTSLAEAQGFDVVTIEGLSENADHPVQQAWIEGDVPQCGYCQAGQIMNAASFLAQTPSPTAEQIDSAMQGNICRCGTYQRIKAAISEAALELGKEV